MEKDEENDGLGAWAAIEKRDELKVWKREGEVIRHRGGIRICRIARWLWQRWSYMRECVERVWSERLMFCLQVMNTVGEERIRGSVECFEDEV